VGDALNREGVHVVLVTDIQYDDDGEISLVGIMELNAPKATYTLYGDDGDFPLRYINRKYLNNGYTILRYNDRESVVYIHDCTIPLDDDYCDKCVSDHISAPLPPFIDIRHQTRYADAVDFMAELGVFTGTNQNTNSQDYAIKRGMFIVLLARFSGSDISRYTKSPFDDVPIDEWYGQAIAWAADVGIVEVTSSMFEPRHYISNEEMAQTLYEYFRWRSNTNPTSTPVIFLQSN